MTDPPLRRRHADHPAHLGVCGHLKVSAVACGEFAVVGGRTLSGGGSVLPLHPAQIISRVAVFSKKIWDGLSAEDGAAAGGRQGFRSIPPCRLGGG